MLEESRKRSFSCVSRFGGWREAHDSAFSQLEIADQANSLAGGFPKMPSTKLLKQLAQGFSPMFGAFWMGQRDEYWVID